jgi:threonine aldolase
MEAVKDYLNNLAGSLKNRVELDGAVKLSFKKSSNMIYLIIHRSDYISQVLIPFFDSLT